MTLGFTTKINGQPNYFIEKIINGLLDKKIICADAATGYLFNYYEAFPGNQPGIEHILSEPNVKPKLHTFREDNFDRWQPGKLIHAVIGNRTPKRYQFVPLFKCISTQLVRIDSDRMEVFIQEPQHYRQLPRRIIEQMAVNDGFENIFAFFSYFKNNHSNLKLIHWTDLKY